MNKIKTILKPDSRFQGNDAARAGFTPVVRVQHSTTGFTLMEVLISLMILAVGLASVFALLGTGTQSHRRAVRDTAVSSYARTILAELESGVHSSGFTFQEVKDQTHPAFPSLYKYDLEFKKTLDTNDNLVVAVLTIKWPHGKQFDSAKFETVLLRK